MKSIMKLILSKLGYRIERIGQLAISPSNPDTKVAASLPLLECYSRFQTDCPIFQPWMGYGDFVKVMTNVKENTLVSADRCYLLWKFAQHAKRLTGDFVECGVYRGGTALLLAKTLQDDGRKLWLFDSFEGLPQASQEKGDFYQLGDFGDTSFEAVSKLLSSFFSQIEIRKGWIPVSFDGLDHLAFSFAHVDVDLYEPALECCRFIYPRLVPGGIMIFDDYGFPACRGERNAVDGFFSNMNQPVISLPTGQGLVIKA